MLPLLNEDLRCFSVPVGQARDTATSKIRHLEEDCGKGWLKQGRRVRSTFFGAQKKVALTFLFSSCAVPRRRALQILQKKGRSIRLFSFVHSSTRVSRVFL